MQNLLRLLIFLRLKKVRSIAQITSPMARIVAELEEFAATQSSKSMTDAEAADRLLERSKEQEKAASEARALSGRYSALTV